MKVTPEEYWAGPPDGLTPARHLKIQDWRVTNSFVQLLALDDGWSVTHIIHLDPCWQINAKDDHYLAFATGETIEEALINLRRKILEEDFSGLRFTGNAPPLEFLGSATLAQRLGLVPKAKVPVIKRRI